MASIALETLETFLGLHPGEKAANSEEIAALQADPKYERFQPLLAAVDAGAIDVDAILALRSASYPMIQRAQLSQEPST